MKHQTGRAASRSGRSTHLADEQSEAQEAKSHQLQAVGGLSRDLLNTLNAFTKSPNKRG